MPPGVADRVPNCWRGCRPPRVLCDDCRPLAHPRRQHSARRPPVRRVRRRSPSRDKPARAGPAVRFLTMGWALLGVSLIGVAGNMIAAQAAPQRRLQRYRKQAIKHLCRLRLLLERPCGDWGPDDLHALHPGMGVQHKSVGTLVAGLPWPERRAAARRLRQLRRAEVRTRDRLERLAEPEPGRDDAEIRSHIEEHGQSRFLEKIHPLTLTEKRRRRPR